jgi:hypothetical protein
VDYIEFRLLNSQISFFFYYKQLFDPRGMVIPLWADTCGLQVTIRLAFRQPHATIQDRVLTCKWKNWGQDKGNDLPWGPQRSRVWTRASCTGQKSRVSLGKEPCTWHKADLNTNTDFCILDFSTCAITCTSHYKNVLLIYASCCDDQLPNLHDLLMVKRLFIAQDTMQLNNCYVNFWWWWLRTQAPGISWLWHL